MAKKKLAKTLSRFQEKRKKAILNEYNPLNSEKFHLSNKNKKKVHKQQTQKDIIPFTDEDSILLVGEGKIYILFEVLTFKNIILKLIL